MKTPGGRGLCRGPARSIMERMIPYQRGESMKQQERRTWAEISLPNLEHNYRALRALLPEGLSLIHI